MSAGKIQFAENAGTYVLKFVGDVRMTLCTTLDKALEHVLAQEGFKSILVDLTETEGIDSTSLGLLAKLSIQARKRFGMIPTIISSNEDINRILLSMGFDKVFVIVKEGQDGAQLLRDLPSVECSEKAAREKVLAAHRELMNLNEENRVVFHDLVRSLENDAR
ncbi:STAS domain-containing protein [Kistimonas asteriae]|uniref:STAS domain-containing protein n=1 Tax=Kistimonas asteriae TaxID=517724 RepID=UPI001BA7DE7B|nr:STAS domain-containing protein [Kistimonas asteriae]